MSNNPWIIHVKKTQALTGLSYKDAMKEAKKTYKKQEGEGILDDVGHLAKRGLRKIRRSERKLIKSIEHLPQKAISGIRKEAIHLLKSRPAKLKKFMKGRGKKKIIHVEICRTPVLKNIQTALNLLSSDAFKKEEKKKSYDDMYHLYLVMTFEDGIEIAIEKNEVLKITRKPEKRPNSECKSAPANMVFNDMMALAEANEPNLYRYTAWRHNCQRFIWTLLTVLGAPENLKSFVLQDFTGAFKGNKKLKKFAIAATDIAALGRRLLGAGKNNTKYIE